MTIRLLAIAGSARRESYNRKLLLPMAEGARAAGAEVELLDWQDYPLPLMNEDVEAAGIPEPAPRLKAALRAADGFLIATPENNGGYPVLLKNAFDWASRPLGEGAGSVYKNKPVIIAGATPGRWGAVRSIRQLREVMGYMGCIVLPDTLSLNDAARAFDADGRLLDAKVQALAGALGATLARTTRALKA